MSTTQDVVPPRSARRISSVDIVRGAAIVFMALDHVRDFTTNQRFRPEDMSKTTAALFATRWITHFCAPTFFLMAGIGIGIAYNRGRRPADLSRYLIARGFWLLILELIITPVGWQLGFHLLPAFAVVLWALGWSMILMAALVHVPRTAVAVFSAVMIFGHNLLDRVNPDSLGSFGGGLWHMLHVPGFIIPNKLFIAYPIIPWVAVMAAGFVIAAVFQWDAARRRTLLLQLGGACIVLFILLRLVNHYGDPQPWSAQRSGALSVASFLNVLKYPPSLDFLLMTLGPAIVFLALAERMSGAVARFLTIYGRVPLFFYVMHIFVAHLAAVTLAFAQSGHFRRIPVVTDPGSIPAWYGLSLPGVYLIWALVVLALYFPCRRFNHFKDTRNSWWVSYL